METGIDSRLRPSVVEMTRARAAERPDSGAPSRKAFANHRISATNEVTTLGPESEARTPDAELRFEDLVDVVNPLHHIPFVGSFYRSVSGDEITAAARTMGALLYTGPLGFAYATVDSLFAEINGRPLGDTLVAAVFGGDDADPAAPAPGAQDLAEGAARENVPEPEEPAVNVADTAEASGDAETGEAALRALAADLRLLASDRETEAPAAATPPLVRDPEPPVSQGFARKMTEALDKYRAMAAARTLEEARTADPAAAVEAPAP